jgi:trigger factor
MSLTVEKLEHSMAKLTIEVPAEEFVKAMTAAYNKQKNKFNVPGFRKGKVPQSFIEKMYGPEVFYEDAANALINEYYPKEVENAEVEIVSRPEIDVTQIEKGKNFIFTADVAVKPEVTLGDYKGIEVPKAEVSVTDEDVMAELLKVQKENSRMVSVTDRPAKLDDEILLDFDGSVDGVPFDGGKAENYKLVLGSHSFIDTFEDQLVGKNIGEETDVNVTFPEEYQAEDLAGKAAVFKCVIREIKEAELPELDDEFASEVSDFETLDEYKEDIRKTALVKKEKEAKDEKEGKVIDKIIENSTMDVSDAQIKDTQESIKENFAQQLSYQGIKLEQYLQIVGSNEDAFLESVKPEAERRIKSRLVLEAVAEAEKLEVTEEEVDEELSKMAEQYQMELETVKQFMGEKERAGIKDDLAVRKAAQFVVDNATEV